MKKLLLLTATASLLMTSCDKDSVTDEFNNSNGDTAKKLIEKIAYDSLQFGDEDYDLTVEYDTNNRVISASNGEEEGVLVYENNELTTITGGTEPFSMDELYKDPYDAYERGEVLEYDQSGNPIVVSVLQEDYEYIDGQYVETTEEFIATITYDATPNPYFYTFQAAGLIAVMDKVELNFSMLPQPAEIIKARALFPVNNPKNIVYRNENNEKVGEVKMDYVYDTDNYPTSATFTVETEDEPIKIYTAKYFYR